MRFALLGDHPDGLDMARALADTGRHHLVVYSGAPLGREYLRRWGLEAKNLGDLEEVLADPAIEVILVAGSAVLRPAQLRRALQSERHVLCVHPSDQTPDMAYEAAMIQRDTGRILLPLLPESFHPGLARLLQILSPDDPKEKLTLRSHVDPVSTRLIELEIWSTEQALLEVDGAGHKPGFPGWNLLRRLGGDIVEVQAFSIPEEVTINEPILLVGRFQKKGLFQVTLLPGQGDSLCRLAVVQQAGRVELLFPGGWPGPARLTWKNSDGSECREDFPSWNPWPSMVAVFEDALVGDRVSRSGTLDHPLTWQDEIRCLELDDAGRRSIVRRRASTLEFQEASEEVGFKGTMTLLGCGILWASILLLILSVWIPWLGWLIAPIFGLFLVLQLFRWVAQPGPSPGKPGSDR